MLIRTACDEVMTNAGRNQVLIYVHSGEDTFKRATAIRDLCKKHSSERHILEENSPSQQELSNKAKEAKVHISQVYEKYRLLPLVRKW